MKFLEIECQIDATRLIGLAQRVLIVRTREKLAQWVFPSKLRFCALVLVFFRGVEDRISCFSIECRTVVVAGLHRELVL